MRKLLLSAITLFLFSTSILFFQISCQKDVLANPNVISENGFILFTKFQNTFIGNETDSVGNVVPIYRSAPSFYRMNYDGQMKLK
jgi:hypothetical protein